MYLQFLRTVLFTAVSSCFLLGNTHAASCNNTHIVTSLSDMTSALDCAQSQETTEIIIDSYIYISDPILIVDIPNLTIRGVTEDAALQYLNNLQHRRLLLITNSTIQLQSLLLKGDSSMGCMVITTLMTMTHDINNDNDNITYNYN